MRLAVALGGNLGDSPTILRTAVGDLGIIGPVQAVSSLYRSAPVGGPEQGPYLNAVVVIETSLPPRQVLRMLQGIEERHGRIRSEHWGPRTLDLDIIVSDIEVVDAGPELLIPHPRALERRFVLEPLAEVWPEAPFGELTAATALEAVLDQDVTRLEGTSWSTVSDRGGRWVTVQFALFSFALIAAIVDVGSMGDVTWMPWIGRGLILAGGAEMFFGVRALGRNLTAFPEPLAEGRLIHSGVYRLVRHPLYGANVLLIAGLGVHQRSWFGLGVAVLAAGFFWAKAGHEEERLVRKYAEYDEYRGRVRSRLIPWIL